MFPHQIKPNITGNLTPTLLGTIVVPGNPLDPHTRDIIDAIETAGGFAMPAEQKPRIDTFVRAGYTSGDVIKRFNLQIWANAAANAIDWVTLGSGSFHDSITHAAGYTKSDGIDGRFDMGASLHGVGATGNSNHIGCLVALAASQTGYFMSAQATSSTVSLNKYSSSAYLSRNNSGGFNAHHSPLSYANAVGVFMSNRPTFDGFNSSVRNASGVSRVASGADNSATHNNTSNMNGFCENNSGAYHTFSNAGIGVFFMGVGIPDIAAEDAQSLAIANLWSDCSSLPLPG